MEEGLGFLLDDAKSVALYGSRSGKLTSAAIFLAISRFEQAQEKSWRAAETANLQSALAQAVSEIAPVTLIDLRDNNPFAEANQNRKKRYILIVASILLMALTAHLTVLYNKQKDFVERIAELRADNPETKLGNVARAWRDATIANDAKPTETYFTMLEEVRLIDRRARELTQINQELERPWLDSFRDVVWGGADEALVSTAKVSSVAGIQTLTSPQQAGVQIPISPQQIAGSMAANGMPYCGTPTAVIGEGIPVDDKFFETGPGKQLLANRLLNLKFSCAEGFFINPVSIGPILRSEQYVQQRLVYFSQWLLPALYAALGSLVYYMRSVLNPTMPDPGYEHIAHRVALGAFAGIIFAWFWSPGSGTSGGLSALNVNSFAIAFIIGFSIDIFFTALDRFVSFMQSVVAAPRTNIGILEIPLQVAPRRDTDATAPENATTNKSGGGTKTSPQINSFPR